MANNISKYLQLNDYLLLEMEFSKDDAVIDLTGITSTLATTSLGSRQYFNNNSLGTLNNDLIVNSEPLNSTRSNWYITNNTNTSLYWNFFDSSVAIAQSSYYFDTIKIHIVSGYNFDDIPGFLLQVQAKDTSDNLVDLSNFTWVGQILGNQVLKFSTNALYLGNRFYDKYVEFKVPSVENLAGATSEAIESALLISQSSDIYFTYSTIANLDDTTYLIENKIEFQLPFTSVADNFNAFIAESTVGDFIEFYATWNDTIIGEYMGDIESGRIKLYTSNNPNDNFEEFSETYGAGAAKWVVMHELYVYEHIPGNTLMTQKFVFTQEGDFNYPNYFRPIIKNSDIVSSYSINYVCRLTNRMDGTQIIRKASFASTDPKKYGKKFVRLNTDNFIPYKVFNRVEGEASNTITMVDNKKTKFVKVYYDTTRVMLDMDNNVLPQGTGPLFLKNGGGVHKLSFSRLNESSNTGSKSNVDLSGAFNYAILFVLDNDNKIEIPPTYSTNMNTTLGELEFDIKGDQVTELLKQNNNVFSIIIKNPNGTSYTFYEGYYYPITNYQQVLAQYSSIIDVDALKNQIAELQAENKALKNQISGLSS